MRWIPNTPLQNLILSLPSVSFEQLVPCPENINSPVKASCQEYIFLIKYYAIKAHLKLSIKNVQMKKSVSEMKLHSWDQFLKNYLYSSPRK